MPRQALAVLAALLAGPTLAEPYRPLPRYPADASRSRIVSSRRAQKIHGAPPVEPAAAVGPAQQDAKGAKEEPAQAEAEEAIHVIAIPALPEKPPAAARARRAAPAALRAPVVAKPAATPATMEARPGGSVDDGSAAAVTEASAVAVPAAARRARASELKVSVGQTQADGGFVMLVEDGSGARIELVLDADGRLLSVRPAGAL